MNARIEILRTRYKTLEPLLSRPIRVAERYRRRQRRGRPPIPARIASKALAASAQLELLRLRGSVVVAETELVDHACRFIVRSKPARLAGQAAEAERMRQAKVRKERDAERRRAEDAGRKAKTTEQQAVAAAKRALANQRGARTEVERRLAGQRATLETVKAKQARLAQKIAKDRSSHAKRREDFETFRGTIARTLSQKKSKRAAFDGLYDQVVARLVKLRPETLRRLWIGIKGSESPPGPPETLAVADLEKGGYNAVVKELATFRDKLEKDGEKLDEERAKLNILHLELLQSEIAALNLHRTKLLVRISPSKRSALIGISRDGIAQLLREVSQLMVDALYWGFRRLRQIDQIPRLVLDIFTVGSTLWMVLQALFLLWLLRFALRRWDGWLMALDPQVDRIIGTGRLSRAIARLLDLLRLSGRPLLVLITAMVVYRMAGGVKGPTELRVLYILVFWIAAYRVQLRVVEGIAKQVGLGKALEAAQADEELLEEEEDLEGPPAPLSVRLAAANATAAPQGAPAQKVVPGAVLTVRSVRAATRYILVIMLLLELTALAVGHGTIYYMTSKFSWLATIPFVIYFLRLWQPHIA
ncbi:MAG: hypothetical protein KAI47_28385, partial [Deltaproteobacteria bacterium]|nr:hypothetical protein [Deltaproteobacteria bacterium]